MEYCCEFHGIQLNENIAFFQTALYMYLINFRWPSACFNKVIVLQYIWLVLTGVSRIDINNLYLSMLLWSVS